MRFDGKVAVVTGAATGMGAATARLLAAEGAQLVLGDVNESGGMAIAEELRAVFMRTDVGVRADVESADRNGAVARHGRIDILFNNAGIGHYGKTPATSAEAWERVIAVDLNAVFYACHAAIPHMPKPGGAIINNASISGLGGDHAMSAYNAAKGALVNYTRSLAVDHAAEGIRVNAICPGLAPIATHRHDDPAKRQRDGLGNCRRCSPSCSRRGPKPSRLILMAHGGPCEPRATMESWDRPGRRLSCQSEAMRPATSPSRGSSGYGTEFGDKGKGQWGVATGRSGRRRRHRACRPAEYS